MPKRILGVAGVISYLVMIIAMTTNYSLGVIFTRDFIVEHWQYFLTIPAPICVIRFVLILFVNDDTPRFLFTKYGLEKGREYS